MLEKVKFLRDRFSFLDIGVDGGVGPSNVGLCGDHGANMIVAGTSVINSPNRRETIEIIRSKIQESLTKSNNKNFQN